MMLKGVGSSTVLFDMVVRCRVWCVAAFSFVVRWFWRYVDWFRRKPELGFLSGMFAIVLVCACFWVWFLIGFGDKVGVTLTLGPVKVEGSPVTVNTYVGTGTAKDVGNSGKWKRVSSREVTGVVSDGEVKAVP